MAPWAFDNNAQSTSPGAITNAQLTLTLASSAAFAGLAAGLQAVLLIQDTGVGGVGVSKFEFVLATANNTGTNTITLSQRGYDNGPGAQSFVAGATVTQVMSKATFSGAFPMSGLTGSGPPTIGTYQLGNIYFDGDGNPWVCTTAGTPGTWRAVGLHRLSILTGALGTYDFTSISQRYSYLECRFKLRDNSTNNSSNNCAVTFNGDGGANYAYEFVDGVQSSATAGEFTNQTSIPLAHCSGGGVVPATAYTTGFFRVYSYTDLTGRKAGEATQNGDRGDGAGGNVYQGIIGRWKTTNAAINRITIPPGAGTAFDANSFAELFGVA